MKNFTNLICLCTAILLFTACASDKPIYRGQVLNGIPHGTGTKFFPDGAKYQGQWSNGEMSGNGLLTWPDGSRYEGNFAAGKFSGQGKMKYPAGEVYEGAWQAGKRAGHGLMIFSNGNRYDGIWQEDAQQGSGTQAFNNGNFFMGSFAGGQYHGDGAGVAYHYGSTETWCIDECVQSSPQFAVISGNFTNGRAETVTTTPCGTSQEKCKTMVAPALAAIVKERARKLAEAEREKERLAAEAEKERKRKEAALLAEQKRKEEERLAFLNTGSASQVYVHADKLETDKDYVQATEAYRTVVTRFPESPFAAAAMTRLGVMRDKRDQQETEQKRLAIEAEQRRNEEAKRQNEAAERKAERETEAAQRQADRDAMANQQQKAATGAACVELAKALCDQTTSGFANSICKASAGIGCN